MEYHLSPGIMCKFDILMKNINSKRIFLRGIDLGSSGNSILFYLDNIKHKSFFDIANLPLNQYRNKNRWHPLCGDLTRLPYRDRSFDFVSALDVIEHIKNDELAVSEISRILKKNGVAMITVPHKMKFYTNQDKMIGHYRRYEIIQVISLFRKFKLKILQNFGVYGPLMKIADIQSSNPQKVEASLIKLRTLYSTYLIFRKIWNLIVAISARIMKLDAKFHSLNKMMNIGLLFEKQ